MFSLFRHFSKLNELIHRNVTNGKGCSPKGKKCHKFQRCSHAHHSDELIYSLSKSTRYWYVGRNTMKNIIFALKCMFFFIDRNLPKFAHYLSVENRYKGD